MGVSRQQPRWAIDSGQRRPRPGFWVWVAGPVWGAWTFGEDQAAPTLLTAQSAGLYVSPTLAVLFRIGIASGPMTRSPARQ